MKIVSANRIAPDGTPRSAASHLGLLCLSMSHKKDARLIWVKRIEYNFQGVQRNPLSCLFCDFFFFIFAMCDPVLEAKLSM